jgi:CDP-paratose 2-epimerase
MFWHFYQNPKQGEAYNAGGSRFSNCSMMEGITLCEQISGNKMNYQYVETNRIGDHIWYISDVSKFKQHYPEWDFKYDLNSILVQIHESMLKRV